MRISDWSSDVCSSDLRPLPYAGERSIRALLEGLQRFGWAAVTEGDNVIALAKNGAGVSLQPGGQFELSGAPLKTIHATCAEVHTHLDQNRQVAGQPRVPEMGPGFHPEWTRQDIPCRPRGTPKNIQT